MNESEIKKELVEAEKLSLIAVTDKQSYEMAGAAVLALDAIKKKIVDYWAEPKKKAHEAHKSITEKEKQMLRPIEERRAELNKKISDFLTAEKRRRDEEQKKIDEENRKREEAERQKLIKKAEKAVAAGKDEKAEELKMQAESVFIPKTIVQPVVEKTTTVGVAGAITAKTDIFITIDNPIEVIMAIAAGRLPIDIVEISANRLKSYAKENKLSQLPGCTVEEREVATFRRG